MPAASGNGAHFSKSTSALKTLHATSQRTLSALPIVVYYKAPLVHATQVMRAGEVAFVTNQIHQGHFLEPTQCDAFQIRDEFLKITTPREAVNFLCQSGDFIRYRSSFTWAEFQKWQRLAEVVTFERPTLTQISQLVVSGKKTAKVDPTGELTEILSFITGKYSGFFDKHPKSGGEKSQPDDHWNTEQSRLGRCFSEPDRLSLSVRYVYDSSLHIETQLFGTESECTLLPSNPDARHKALMPTLLRESQQNTVLYPDTPRLPVLVIRPRCTVEAIAAANYADRISGVTVVKCAGCSTIFVKETRGTKTYCDPRCKDRHKKWKKRHPCE